MKKTKQQILQEEVNSLMNSVGDLRSKHWKLSSELGDLKFNQRILNHLAITAFVMVVAGFLVATGYWSAH